MENSQSQSEALVSSLLLKQQLRLKKKPNLLKIFPCQMLILLGYLMRVAQVFRGKFFRLFFFFWFQTLMHCRLKVALLCGRKDRNFLFGSLFRFSYKYNSLYIFPRTISVPQSPQISLSFTLGKIWYLGMGNIRGKYSCMFSRKLEAIVIVILHKICNARAKMFI